MATVSTIFMVILASVLRVSALDACPKCGNMDVPYPLSSDDNCGDLRYKISCKDGNILEFVSSEGFHYEILSINPSACKLIIRPPKIDKSLCYSSDVAVGSGGTRFRVLVPPLAVGGLRLDENSPFNISNRNTVMLLNCSENILLSPLNCSANSPCRQFEEQVEEGSGCKNTLCCSYLKDSSFTSHKIRVRLGGCSAYTSLVDLKPNDPPTSWNYGIELQWLLPS